MRQIRLRLVKIGDSIELRSPAHSKALHLRKHIPDPVALLLACANLRQRILVITLLGFHKTFKSLLFHIHNHMFKICENYTNFPGGKLRLW